MPGGYCRRRERGPHRARAADRTTQTGWGKHAMDDRTEEWDTSEALSESKDALHSKVTIRPWLGAVRRTLAECLRWPIEGSGVPHAPPPPGTCLRPSARARGCR